MDRRTFLARTAFFTVATASLAGCGRGSDDESSSDAQPAAPPEQPPAGTFVFAQGVASGDPREASLVFWTRCVRADGSGVEVPLTLQVASSPAFTELLAQVPLSAIAAYDHTVRAKVAGLPAGTLVHYRFVAGQDISAAGSGRTAPLAAAGIGRLRFAWIACQDWTINHWGAFSLLAAEELDFVVHLGDYIYETAGVNPLGPVEAAHAPIALPDGAPAADGSRYANTLADYRALYRAYRGDARLQALHAKCPMIAVWDDHEFSDDCWQDHQTYDNSNAQQTTRRRAASQAWVEYLPVDFGDVSFDAANPAYDNLRIYRDFRFGSLMHLIMTDERLYRDDHLVSEASVAIALDGDPVAGNDFLGARFLVPRETLDQAQAQRTATLGRAPSMLGPTQTNWFKQTIAGASTQWKVWGNEVMLNRLWLDLRNRLPAPLDRVLVVDADAWDGYPAHKAELTGFLAAQRISNVVAITGDLHAFQCGVVRDSSDPVTGVPVLVDFVTAGISSASLFSFAGAGTRGTALGSLLLNGATLDRLLRSDNPDLLYADHDAQGYATVTLTPEQMVVVFTKVKPLASDGTVPADPVAERTRITLASGSYAPVIEAV